MLGGGWFFCLRVSYYDSLQLPAGCRLSSNILMAVSSPHSPPDFSWMTTVVWTIWACRRASWKVYGMPSGDRGSRWKTMRTACTRAISARNDSPNKVHWRDINTNIQVRYTITCPPDRFRYWLVWNSTLNENVKTIIVIVFNLIYYSHFLESISLRFEPNWYPNDFWRILFHSFGSHIHIDWTNIQVLWT